jgi:hypothetical protein
VAVVADSDAAPPRRPFLTPARRRPELRRRLPVAGADAEDVVVAAEDAEEQPSCRRVLTRFA